MTERERALLMGKKVNPLTANESALAYAVAHGGGSEPTYETVAEIEVGTMEKPEGVPFYVFTSDKAFPVLDEETYYFNSSNNPSDSLLSYEGQVMGSLWNAKAEGTGISPIIIPIDPNKPWFGITQVDNKIAAISDTDDLSNTTVRILKEASAPSGGGKMVVHLTESTEAGETVYSADKTVAEIIAADAAGQVVECVNGDTGTGATRLALTFIQGTTVIFGVQGGDSGVISSMLATGTAKDGEDDEWSWDENDYRIPSNLKPTYEFGFSMSVDQQGNFTVTADQGSTFAAIKTALDQTPNVYAIVNSSGQRSRTIITADSDSGLTLNTMHVSQGTFILLSVAMDNSDTITTVSKTIT